MEQQAHESSLAFAGILDAMYTDDTQFSVPEAGTMVTADGRFTITMRTALPGLDHDGNNSDINSGWFVRDGDGINTLAAVVYKCHQADEDVVLVNEQYHKIEELISWIFERETEMDYRAFLGLPPNATDDEVDDRLCRCAHINISGNCPDEDAVRTRLAIRMMHEEEEEDA